jgi:hypothetical protein
MNRLLETLHSGAQGASNGVAGVVAGPVDTLAVILRKMGVPVPADPVAGEQWMRKMGLMQEPKNKLAGLVGEGVGMALPAIPAGRLAK